uniref:Lipid-binding serum glycoprotein N-terminal domain-containing protein n=1 Tax=Sinocyclocheilus grahami TaxID=75366 RepID=A0A672NKR6_SINGR
MERSAALLLVLALVNISCCCLDPPAAYGFTGAVCRLTYPAAVVLNEKTTEVIQAAFQHAKYPSVEGQRSIGFGTVKYGFHNLEIHNLSIGKSEFELKENEGIGISISNVSAVFKGTINYGYGSQVSAMAQLWFNPVLYYVFNEIIIFCLYMNFKVSSGQPVKKSHTYISVMASQLFFFFKKCFYLAVYGRVREPSDFIKNIQLTENRMLYFWISDGLLDPLMSAAHHDGRFIRNISGTELTDLFQTELSSARPELLNKWLSSEGPMLKARSVSVPHMWTTTEGTSVRAVAGVELLLDSQDMPALYFETDVTVVVNASYAEKKLILKATADYKCIFIHKCYMISLKMEENLRGHLQEAVEKMGIPKVISYLEPELTALMDEQGLNLFDIINPEVLPQDGYVIVQLDFGFPQHLLVEFLKRTLN